MRKLLWLSCLIMPNLAYAQIFVPPIVANGTILSTSASAAQAFGMTAGATLCGDGSTCTLTLKNNSGTWTFAGGGLQVTTLAASSTVTATGTVTSSSGNLQAGGGQLDIGSLTRGAQVTGGAQGGTTYASTYVLKLSTDSSSADYQAVITAIGNNKKVTFGGVINVNGGDDLTVIHSGTLGFNFANEAVFGCEASSNVTVTGAALGDSCILGISIDQSAAAGTFTCVVTTTNTAKVVYCGGGDPANATYTVRTIR